VPGSGVPGCRRGIPGSSGQGVGRGSSRRSRGGAGIGVDLAPYVNASLQVMAADSRLMRGEKPFIMTNCHTGEGIPAVVALMAHDVLFDVLPAFHEGPTA
jgi:hypothetical protein